MNNKSLQTAINRAASAQARYLAMKQELSNHDLELQVEQLEKQNERLRMQLQLRETREWLAS